MKTSPSFSEGVASTSALSFCKPPDICFENCMLMLDV